MDSRLILFSGNLGRTIRDRVSDWRRVFVEKYGEAQCIVLPLESTDPKMLESELSAPPFFAEKRLIILSGPGDDVLEQKESEKRSRENSETAVRCLANFPENNFVLAYRIDHEVFADLKRVFTSGIVKNFSASSRADRMERAREALGESTKESDIAFFVDRIGEDVNRFENELAKLSLVEDVNRSLIEQTVTENIESSVFRLQDALYAGNQKNALSELKAIYETETVREAFRTLLSQLRNAVYFWTLRDSGFSKSEAASCVGMKPYPADKAEAVPIEKRKMLRDFFDALVTIDRDEKIGKLIGEGDEALNFALERAIFALKTR